MVYSQNIQQTIKKSVEMFYEDLELEVSKLLEIVTCKDDWYQKIFDDKIVSKWKEELKDKINSSDSYNLAIKILRSTSQGSDINFGKDCSYEEIYMNCRLKSDDSSEECYDTCPHVTCSCTSPDNTLTEYIDSGSFLGEEMIDNLKTTINTMLAESEIDWHPDSDQRVRDLIHPSLYCYAPGVTPDDVLNLDNTTEIKMRWLPSELSVDTEYNCKYLSYINNYDEGQFTSLKPQLEDVLKIFVPKFEKILKKDLKDKRLQVITKISSTHLSKDKPNFDGGSWHIEGVPEENIVATGIHYLTVEGISDSYLEFRKPTYVNDDYLDYPQHDHVYTRHHYGLTDHHDGEMNRYLGLIKCKEGKSAVFPNTLQHHVKDFSLKDGINEGTRIIVVFFLIDPDRRVASTENIAPQQDLYTREQAEYLRDILMFQRKYFVDRLNKEVYERPYSLCEH